MSLPDKLIVFLGRTLSGHHHDYTRLQQEFPPDVDWFSDLHVRVDRGYLGIQSDYRGEQIAIPTKKPRKSHKNPNPLLSCVLDTFFCLGGFGSYRRLWTYNAVHFSEVH